RRAADAGRALDPVDDDIPRRLRLDEMLLVGDRGAALRDRGAPVLWQPQVPPAPARRPRGTERMGARAETEVVRSVPVGRVVTRREARARPARDLVARQAGGREPI